MGQDLNETSKSLGKALGAQGPRQRSRECKEPKEEHGQAWLPEEQYGGQ